MPRFRLTVPLPVEITNTRGEVWTLDVERTHWCVALKLERAGATGHWEPHTFAGWERDRVETLLYVEGIEIRGAAWFARLFEQLAHEGHAEQMVAPSPP